jgi:hypothetical protein
MVLGACSVSPCAARVLNGTRDWLEPHLAGIWIGKGWYQRFQFFPEARGHPPQIWRPTGRGPNINGDLRTVPARPGKALSSQRPLQCA